MAIQKRKSTPKSRGRAHGRVAAAGTPSKGISEESPKGVRLNRFLAEQGLGSRRGCDAMVLEGSVEVDGKPMLEPGFRVTPEHRVSVDGEPVKKVRRLYYVFHKPTGVLCTESPREKRPKVSDFLEAMVPGRVFMVGRLDEDSSGLLLLTNDGDFSELMTHPRHGIWKTYEALVAGVVDAAMLKKMKGGVHLDGKKVVPKKMRVVRKTRNTTRVEVVLGEGVNREVRRLFARFGFNVKRLARVRVGNLGLKGLRKGGLRPLTLEERDSLVSLARK